MTEGGEVSTVETPIVLQRSQIDGHAVSYRKLALGVEAAITLPKERQGPGERAVKLVILAAVAHPSKKDELGEGLASDRRVVLWGGQDAVGAKLMARENLQAIAVAADGCSLIGGQRASLEAAKIAVTATIDRAGKVPASSTRDEVTKNLEKGVQEAQGRIEREAPEGATTLAVAAVGIDRSSQKPEVYLHALGVGDGQVTVVYKTREGGSVVRRVLAPADLLDAKLKASGVSLDSLANVRKLWEERSRVVADYARQAGKSVPEMEKLLTESGIWSFLGKNEEVGVDAAHLWNEAMRLNLTADVFTPGGTSVVVLASSDYIGEKLNEQEIAAAHHRAYGAHRTGLAGFMTQLRGNMARGALDDGGVAGFEVTQPSG